MEWKKYPKMENYGLLREEGRETIGKRVWLTEKRDGSNISIWLKIKEGGNEKIYMPAVSSHNMEEAAQNFKDELKKTKEYIKAYNALVFEKINYNNDYILYGELIIKGYGPTRIEPKHKIARWILFDIYDANKKRFLNYPQVYAIAKIYHLPVVKLVGIWTPKDIDDFKDMAEYALKWAKRHKREGIVSKIYDGEQ